jgi:hypothetical protein
VKHSDATSFSELVRQWHQFTPFCTDIHAVTKRSETYQNMSFSSNGVGSGAFVAKNSGATSFSELVREWHQFGLFSTDIHAVTK